MVWAAILLLLAAVLSVKPNGCLNVRSLSCVASYGYYGVLMSCVLTKAWVRRETKNTA
ncbi:MAG: hypothetical protein ACKERG_00940 [Candidatus Hodgkinia cicadicola]